MIDPAGGEAKRSLQVGGFEVRHFVQDLLGRESGSKQIEYIADADAHASNAGATPALLRIDGDSFGDHVHNAKYISRCSRDAPYWPSSLLEFSQLLPEP